MCQFVNLPETRSNVYHLSGDWVPYIYRLSCDWVLYIREGEMEGGDNAVEHQIEAQVVRGVPARGQPSSCELV